jgi:hypothetical protein
MPHDSHWHHWHARYAEADSSLNRRLSIVRAHIVHWCEHRTPTEEQRVLSLCAGDGRDVLSVLAQRPADAATVRTVLVELDPGLASAAQRRADDAGLTQVDVRHGDAGRTSTYADAVPADLLLLCGIFGNIDDEDVRRTVLAVPQLVAANGTIVWTRSRRAPDLTPQIREWFAEAGCEELAFNAPDGELFSVGAARFTGSPVPLGPEAVLFRFIDHEPS